MGNRAGSSRSVFRVPFDRIQAAARLEDRGEVTLAPLPGREAASDDLVKYFVPSAFARCVPAAGESIRAMPVIPPTASHAATENVLKPLIA